VTGRKLDSPEKTGTTSLGVTRAGYSDEAGSIAQGRAWTDLREPITGPFHSSEQHGSADKHNKHKHLLRESLQVIQVSRFLCLHMVSLKHVTVGCYREREGNGVMWQAE